MLIIPIETKPNWNHPPLVTIAIILINLVVFLAYQSNDEKIAEQAAKFYIDNGLLKEEEKLLDEYLLSLNTENSRMMRSLRDHPNYNINLAYYAFYQRQFDEKVARTWSREIDTDPQWKQKRQEFEQFRDRYSSFAYGLTPAESDFLNYITSTFLHGSWGHIIGNMVFLFLFGFLLELVLGPLLYLAIYMTTGILAGAFFVLFNSNSYTPLIGASGAVSGLMGAYIVMYGLRRIRFFYTIGFYFGEFKAPALAIFPLWLAKEIYGHFQLNDQVAYLAHFGGLVSGAAAMAGIRHIKGEKTAEKIETFIPEKSEDQSIIRALADISKHAENLDFDGAKRKCKMYLAQNANDLRLWKSYFDLAKLNPKDKEFHQTTFDLLKQASTHSAKFAQHSSAIKEITEEYRNTADKPIVLQNDNLLIRLICFMFENREPEYAAQLLESRFATLSNKKPALKALQLAQMYYNKQNKRRKAEQITAAMEKLRQPSHTGS